MGREQREVFFSGMVQGVGFRYTAHRLATRYDVSGIVRNIPDGRVECIVEGETGEIDAFLEELARAMSGYIRSQTQQTAPYSGKFDSFTVVF
ncbi:MAG: acylphosphatase [Planctomycetota bacterium]|jgi:acylphosphatase